MKQDKLLSAVSLARRSGNLIFGFDAVCEAAKGGQAFLVLLAQDASQGTQKRVRRACEPHCPVLSTHLQQEDIARITHKPAGVLAVLDKDLAKLCQSAFESTQLAGDEEELD